MDQSGGRIQVQEMPDRGKTVAVYLAHPSRYTVVEENYFALYGCH